MNVTAMPNRYYPKICNEQVPSVLADDLESIPRRSPKATLEFTAVEFSYVPAGSGAIRTEPLDERLGLEISVLSDGVSLSAWPSSVSERLSASQVEELVSVSLEIHRLVNLQTEEIMEYDSAETASDSSSAETRLFAGTCSTCGERVESAKADFCRSCGEPLCVPSRFRALKHGVCSPPRSGPVGNIAYLMLE
jgi:hypothetical protein